MGSPEPSARHPSRRIRRAAPIALLATGGFVVGIVAGAGSGDAERRLAERYGAAWAARDHAAMHALLTDQARRRYPLARFTTLHRQAATLATLQRARTDTATGPRDDRVTIGIQTRTHAFGTLRAPLTLPVVDEGGRPRVAWAPHLVFPGLGPGERLRRRTELPARAPLAARDGTVLARGPQAVPTIDLDVSGLVGELGPIPAPERERLLALGVPTDAQVGVSGLERALNADLIGTPGGTLSADTRVLARTRPQAASTVRSSIDLRAQRAARDALAGRYGGIAVLQPGTGEILAAAGIALDGLQPPGSTFKIITLVAGLQTGAVTPSDRFPVQTAATLEGVELQNANGEACGGSLRDSFAESCNSVFAPLGAKAGAEDLVRVAEDFGFNTDPGIPGAVTSTIPPADEIGDDLAVGSTAIGQGKVQATALMMAWVAATVADGGQRPTLTLKLGGRPQRTRIMSTQTAETIGSYMRTVVTSGTGVAANARGVGIAGKTGTAELRRTQGCSPGPDGSAPAGCSDADETDTTAWFSAFAPLRRPQVAVGVVVPAAGAGGDTAAPIARQVIEQTVRRPPAPR